MTLKSVFINQYGRPRSGWRAIAFAVAFFVVFQLLGAVVLVGYHLLTASVLLTSHAFVENMIYRVLILVAAILAGYVCNRVLEGLPFRALGLWPHRKWFQHLLIGSFVGFFSLALAAAIGFAGGGLRFSFTPVEFVPLVLRTLASSAALFIVAALAEEALFRGYPLQTFTRAQLTWFGVLVTSLAFASAHLANPNSELLGKLNTLLAGVWLAVAYIRSRSLWFPLGVHWAWNWTLGSLFGLPVSGMNFGQNTVLRAIDLGPAWLTGGDYGIEGGVACTIALIVSTIVMLRLRLITPNDEMLRMTSNENPVVRQEPLTIRESGAGGGI